ncbi:hypothetical protein E4U54_000068 [Claviceps lovelessii]|nr:hypothetical protein E4U54_000068 [Claviceps lovelessii]
MHSARGHCGTPVADIRSTSISCSDDMGHNTTASTFMRPRATTSKDLKKYLLRSMGDPYGHGWCVCRRFPFSTPTVQVQDTSPSMILGPSRRLGWTKPWDWIQYARSRMQRAAFPWYFGSWTLVNPESSMSPLERG